MLIDIFWFDVHQYGAEGGEELNDYRKNNTELSLILNKKSLSFSG